MTPITKQIEKIFKLSNFNILKFAFEVSTSTLALYRMNQKSSSFIPYKVAEIFHEKKIPPPSITTDIK